MKNETINCRLCSSTNTEKIITDSNTKNERVYHHCHDCDFIFSDEAFVLTPEEEQKRYLNHNNSIENEGYVRIFETFLDEALGDVFEGSETVLDFGCGPNPVFAQIMRRKGNVVDCYDPFYFPNEEVFSKTYDLITSTEVFEHIKYPLTTLQELYDRLSDGGHLAIMTKFHPEMNAFEKWWYRRDVTHISFFNVKTVEKIVEMTDFTLLRTDGKGWFVLKK